MKRERSSNSAPILAKRQRDAPFREPTIAVRITDIPLFQQLVHIGSSVSHTCEISVSPGKIMLKGMDSSQLSCYTSQLNVETPGWLATTETIPGPFFVDLTLIEPGLNTKLYEKLNHSHSQDAQLLMRIRPNERISLSMTGFSDQRAPYAGRHRVMLLDSSPVSVAVESLNYTHTVKFPVSDLKAILNQLSQMKFQEIEFSIFNSEAGQHSALRIFAKSLRNECEHNFFSYGPPDSEMCFSGRPENEAGAPEAMDIGDMKLVLSQSFLCANINNVVKAMRDHYVRFSFARDQPLCIRYDFNSTSFLQYFLSFVMPDCDPEMADMPPIPALFDE